MKDISLKDLLEAGCHFGHKVARWHPKAAEFIYQAREKIHIIDLAKTRDGLKKAGDFIQDLGSNRKTVLMIASKRQAKGVVSEAAKRADLPYMTNRWIGGFLALPGLAKYPLAATLVIAAIYFPLKLVLGLAGGATVKITVLMTNALVALHDTVGDATVLTRVWDTLAGYARLVQTIVGACISVLPSASESPAVFANPTKAPAGIMAVLAEYLFIAIHYAGVNCPGRHDRTPRHPRLPVRQN